MDAIQTDHSFIAQPHQIFGEPVASYNLESHLRRCEDWLLVLHPKFGINSPKEILKGVVRGLFRSGLSHSLNYK